MTQKNNVIDYGVKQYVTHVLEGKNIEDSIVVTDLSKESAEDIEKLTGLKVYGNQVVLEKDTVIHIIKRHGDNGMHDQTLDNPEDIALLGYIINNYDKIEIGRNCWHKCRTKDNKACPTILLSKEFLDTYYVVEAISDSKKKKNYIVTAYVNKKTTH